MNNIIGKAGQFVYVMCYVLFMFATQAIFSYDVDAWIKLGMKPAYHKLQKDEMMYMPAGYIVAERTSTAPMIYGTRKSYFFAEAGAAANFAHCLHLSNADGKDVERMEQVHASLKAAVAALKG